MKIFKNVLHGLTEDVVLRVYIDIMYSNILVKVNVIPILKGTKIDYNKRVVGCSILVHKIIELKNVSKLDLFVLALEPSSNKRVTELSLSILILTYFWNVYELIKPSPITSPFFPFIFVA